jgi:hypothetical protein
MEDLSNGTNLYGKGYYILPSLSSSIAGISTRRTYKEKSSPVSITHLSLFLNIHTYLL